MLRLIIKGDECWNEQLEEFVYPNQTVLMMEHSLVSVSKWESKYHKPFIPVDETQKMTMEELKYYAECMTITQNVNPDVYDALTVDDYKQISDYIDDKMSATFFGDELDSSMPTQRNPYTKKQIITSELIYYWMVSFQIDFKCEKWHLNRLLNLIKICQKKNEAAQAKSSGKHPNRANLASKYAAINARRRQKTGSKG